MKHFARLVVWGAGAVATPLALYGMLGRKGSGLGVALALLATLYVQLWLPRLAHAAFEAGDMKKAARRYRWLRWLAFTPRRERAATLSSAACAIVRAQPARAEALLGRFAPDTLDLSERVVWLNNRACLALDRGDAHDALVLVEQATALRPDVPGLQHTRARALLGVGRIDDAIAVLDSMRVGGELAPHLEAERCRELATAWERKGQGDYAADYRDRARVEETRVTA